MQEPPGELVTKENIDLCLTMYSMTALKHIKIYSVKPDINDFLVFSFKL